MKELLLRIVDLLHLYPLFNRYTRNSATVFMLHRIDAAGDCDGHSLTPGILADHFRYLKQHRYNILSLNEYVQALLNHKDTFKTIVFTVDDGYRDFYLNAFPVFREFSYPATVFVTSDFVERKLFFWWDAIEYALSKATSREIDLGFMGQGKKPIVTPRQRDDVAARITRHCKKLPNVDKLKLIDQLVDKLGVDISNQPDENYEPLRWEEIQEMSKHKIDFHPHTKTHPIMSRVSLEQKREEVRVSKELIESKLNTRANIFCYPNGQWDDFDEETISELKSADYIAAVMGYDGFDNTKTETDMFRLKRFGLPTDQIWFKQYICGLEHFKRRFM